MMKSHKCRVCGFYREEGQGCRYRIKHPRCANTTPDTTRKIAGGFDRIPCPPDYEFQEKAHGNRGKKRAPLPKEVRDKISAKMKAYRAQRRAQGLE